MEKYTFLSRKQLLKEDTSYIINTVRGAWIIYVHNLENVPNRDSDGNFEYTLECTRLTPENRTSLQQHGLELKFIPINSNKANLSEHASNHNNY